MRVAPGHVCRGQPGSRVAAIIKREVGAELVFLHTKGAALLEHSFLSSASPSPLHTVGSETMTIHQQTDMENEI